MAGELARRNDSIQGFDPAAEISNALVGNFEDRGRKAAQLVVATLTESPYSPTIEGTLGLTLAIDSI
ncbi:MAG TPA: hypothetical protein VGF75_04360 [Candidatus Saccharimonadales bacterium]|jgi:hypothetical protein